VQLRSSLIRRNEVPAGGVYAPLTPSHFVILELETIPPPWYRMHLRSSLRQFGLFSTSALRVDFHLPIKESALLGKLLHRRWWETKIEALPGELNHEDVNKIGILREIFIM